MIPSVELTEFDLFFFIYFKLIEGNVLHNEVPIWRGSLINNNDDYYNGKVIIISWRVGIVYCIIHCTIFV